MSTNGRWRRPSLLLPVSLVVVLAAASLAAKAQTRKTTDVTGLTLVNSKTESEVAGQNLMELYVYTGPMDAERLREFLRQKKQSERKYRFYFAVLFHTAANARFPDNPFNGGFSERELRHIRGMYTTTNFNTFSEFETYEKNAWESRAKREKI